MRSWCRAIRRLRATRQQHRAARRRLSRLILHRQFALPTSATPPRVLATARSRSRHCDLPRRAAPRPRPRRAGTAGRRSLRVGLKACAAVRELRRHPGVHRLPSQIGRRDLHRASRYLATSAAGYLDALLRAFERQLAPSDRRGLGIFGGHRACAAARAPRWLDALPPASVTATSRRSTSARRCRNGVDMYLAVVTREIVDSCRPSSSAISRKHQRLHRDRAVREEALLPLDDGLRHTQDGVEALLDVLDEPARFLQPRVQARGGAVARWPRIACAYRSLMRSLGITSGLSCTFQARPLRCTMHVGHDHARLVLPEGPAGLRIAVRRSGHCARAAAPRRRR